jgi:dGTPase
MILNRAKLEKREDQILAAYAIHSKDSKGRQHEEDEHDYRTCFQRDRDRILHTTAFRRLEYKTQVFINHEGDYYRTRLTHSLEVAQIGRTIARALGANEDLTEAICLAHDLGHPPFGHSGEVKLSELMRDYGGFDHNKHTFRIVTKLESRFPDFIGLNLSWEVLEGIVKHETEYDLADADQFFPQLRGHLEAQITNAADELAYTAHDLDDGLRSGLINSEMLTGTELWEIVLDDLNLRNKPLDDLNRHQIICRLTGLLVSDEISATDQKIKENNIKSVDDLQRLTFNVSGLSEEMQRRSRQLKDFLFQNLYRHYRVIRMQMKSEHIITQLFNAYRSEPRMLPTHVQTGIAAEGLERTICDYIAGMTNRFAIEEYNKLFDPLTLP